MKADYEFHRCPGNITDESTEQFLEMVEEQLDLTIFANRQDVLEEVKVKLRRP